MEGKKGWGWVVGLLLCGANQQLIFKKEKGFELKWNFFLLKFHYWKKLLLCVITKEAGGCNSWQIGTLRNFYKTKYHNSLPMKGISYPAQRCSYRPTNVG